MNIDPRGLELDVKPLLEDASQKFKNAQSSLFSISLPSNFQSGVTLKSNIETCMNEMFGTTNSLVNEIENYIEALKQANAEAASTVDGMGIYSGSGDLGSNGNGTNFWDNFLDAGKKAIKYRFGSIEGILDAGLNAAATIIGEIHYNSVAILSNIYGNPEAAEKAAETRDSLKESIAAITDGGLVSNEELNVVGSTLANTGTAILRGGSKLVEGLVDTGAIAANIYFGAKRYFNAAITSAILQNPDILTNAKAINDSSMKDMMSFVKNDFTTEAFNSLYKLNFMQQIDANSVIKYNDSTYLIIEGIAYEAIPAVVNTFAPGVGTAVKGGATFGKTFEEYCSRMNMTTRNGMTEEYNAGKISQEQFEVYQFVWGMSEREYSDNVRLKYFGGEISKEEYEKFETIRNMPQEGEWRTKENMFKATAGSGAIATWEAAQEAVGDKFGALKFGNSAIIGTGVRAFGNAGLNGLDVPVRSLVDSMVLDTSFSEEFQNNGGWTAVGASALIGLATSMVRDATQMYKEARIKRTDEEITKLLANNSENVESVSYAEALARKQEAFDKTTKFFKERPRFKVSQQEIDTSFEKFEIVDKETYYKICRLKNLRPEFTAGINSGDKLIVPVYAKTGTYIHEVVHDFGDILELDGSLDVGALGGNSRAMNEAYTEWYREAISEEKLNPEESLYATNVGLLKLLDLKIRKLGYQSSVTDFLNHSTNRHSLPDALRDITGSDEAYKTLLRDFDIIDRGGGFYKLNSEVEREAIDRVLNFIENLGK